MRCRQTTLSAFCAVIIIMSGVAACGLPAEQSDIERASSPELSLLPVEVAPGGYLVVHVDNVEYEDEVNLHPEMPVRFSHKQGGRVALVAVDAGVEPGRHSFLVEVRRDKRMLLFREVTYEVKEREFATQHLQTTPQMRETRRPELFEEDREQYARAYAETHPQALWEDDFTKPIEGRLTTEFGVERYIDDEFASRHSGLDIAALTGTPVRAANCGVVRLAARLHVGGKTIIVDHGMNLYSVYLHLSSMLVDQGDEVAREEIIGEVGSTGFSTGPHLHWTMSIGGVPICPWLIKEKNPLGLLRELIQEDDSC